MYLNTVKKLFAVVFFGLGVASVSLAQQRELSAASDYAGFQRFPGSDISDYREEPRAVYNLALGRMQRVDGRVVPSNDERLQGRLTRITYEVPSGFTAEEVYSYWRDQLLTGGQSPLFECQGRGCGSSNYWANDKFGNRVLYGPESNQYYLATTFQSTRDSRPVTGYAALYAITRANRRVYAHLDYLELPADASGEITMTPEAVILRMNQDGSVVLRNLSFGDDDALVDDSGIDMIVQTLRRDSLLQVYLVAHLQGDGDLDNLMERSARRANALKEALVGAGIDESRLEAHGVGPLAPYCRPGPCDERVEMVLR
jgi:outer membrane protein OmpA-like peptidoglycan-associated protein